MEAWAPYGVQDLLLGLLGTAQMRVLPGALGQPMPSPRPVCQQQCLLPPCTLGHSLLIGDPGHFPPCGPRQDLTLESHRGRLTRSLSIQTPQRV